MVATSVVTRKQAEPGESVVTPERFEQGMKTFQEWLGAIEKNQEQFQAHYDGYQPDAGEVEAFSRLIAEHGVKALVIGEDWCPDVWRGLPVVCRLSEATGMEIRLFKRDEHKDIMAEFLKDGEFESIPTVVFYNRDHDYLGHWIERPDVANQEMRELRTIFQGTDPNSDEGREKRQEYRQKTFERAPDWRHAQTREMRELLEEALR